ncbi:FxsA family protein [Brachybacterium sp. J144]|uniref:FxsA family protein n=1 Tax=Brachybacterium sp. J144 TaxID=3116487 RepID=UPI002E7A67F5|nr:FxsA family protein [Brachybacterium sp. J144]MEE1651130.1 FxsA family protein [Brachybacterium sp. J144]
MTSSTGTGSERPGPLRSRLGVLVPVGIIALGLIELALLIVIGVNTNLWWPLVIVLVGGIVAVALVVAAGQQSFVRLRSLFRALGGRGDVQKHLSRPAFTLLAALCFAFPGVLSDLIGIILLLTPVQRRTVRAMGLSGGSEGASRVLYRRSTGGVIDGEIILDAQRPEQGPGGQRRTGGEGGSTPPVIQQD